MKLKNTLKIITASLLITGFTVSFAGSNLTDLPNRQIDYTPSGINADTWYAQGSGFFIDANGDIATAAHVVEGSVKVQVEYMGKLMDATVIESDPLNDTAILHINVKNNRYFSLAYPVSNTVGYIFGFPAISTFGKYIHMTSGVIEDDPTDNSVYSIFAKACHGNSGGAVVDTFGRAIGILVYGYQDEATDDNLCSYHSGARYLLPLIAMAAKHKITIDVTLAPDEQIDTLISTYSAQALYKEIMTYDKVVFIVAELAPDSN